MVDTCMENHPNTWVILGGDDNGFSGRHIYFLKRDITSEILGPLEIQSSIILSGLSENPIILFMKPFQRIDWKTLEKLQPLWTLNHHDVLAPCVATEKKTQKTAGKSIDLALQGLRDRSPKGVGEDRRVKKAIFSSDENYEILGFQTPLSTM